MQQAGPRKTLRVRVLPVLLAGACVAGLTGLATVSPESADTAVLGAAGPEVPLAPEAQRLVERERLAARASRGQRIAEVEAAQRAAEQAAAEAAAAEAAARAAAEAAAAEAAARAAAEAAAAQAAAQAAAKAEQQAAARAQAEAEAAAAAKVEAEAVAARAASGACPVPGASFTDTWGAARSGGRSHQGTDLLAPHGAPVYAVTSGRIRTASSSLGGISLYLDGDNGETYFYAHNSSNVASTGQRVQAGDLVARVGSTGNAGSTNHVHFERQLGGRAVNPYDFVRGLC